MHGSSDGRSVPSDREALRFLLDEPYPGWLARVLRADGLDVVALTADRPELRGADDTAVLRTALDEGRVVVTEDVSTFGAAVAGVPGHRGIVYCHHARFPRTRTGLRVLRVALTAFAQDPPEGLGEQPMIWWLTEPAGT